MNELLEPELVHRWPCLPSEIALFSARPHTQSKGSGVGNDRFSLYPLHCSHPAHMKNTVQTQPLILLWIRTTAVQEPDCHFTTGYFFPALKWAGGTECRKYFKEQFILKWKLSLFSPNLAFPKDMIFFCGTEKMFRRMFMQLFSIN